MYWPGRRRPPRKGPQARLEAEAAGVSGVPAYWLLDPAGKLVAKGYDPDEFATVLADRLK